MLLALTWMAAFADDLDIPRGPPPDTVPPPTCERADPWIARQLAVAAKSDQEERRKQRWEGMGTRDALRLALVRAAVEAHALCTPEDAWHAGIVLQHGDRSTDHRDAHLLLRHACEGGEQQACSWVELAWDRFLSSSGSPQWFGTQYQGQLDPETGEHIGMCVIALDPESPARDSADFLRKAWARTHHGDVPETPNYEALVEGGQVCEPSPWGR